jgi:hypothetical protein
MVAAKMGTGKNSAHHVFEAPDAARGQNSCLSPFLPRVLFTGPAVERGKEEKEAQRTQRREKNRADISSVI